MLSIAEPAGALARQPSGSVAVLLRFCCLHLQCAYRLVSMSRRSERLQRGSSKSVDTSAPVLAGEQAADQLAQLASPASYNVKISEPADRMASIGEPAHPATHAGQQPHGRTARQACAQCNNCEAVDADALPQPHTCHKQLQRSKISSNLVAADLTGHKRPRALSMDLLSGHGDRSIPEVRTQLFIGPSELLFSLLCTASQHLEQVLQVSACARMIMCLTANASCSCA